jgi:hypothetical protein
MLSFFRLCALVSSAFLLTACTKEEKPTGSQIIYAGLGISNQLEVGMTLNQVEKKNAHVQVGKRFPTAMRWWQRPFTPVQGYEVTDPRSGAQFVFDSNGRQALMFRFETLGPRGLQHSILRSGSNEISLVPCQMVNRDSIVAAFGEPIHRATNTGQAQAFRARGESVSETGAFQNAEMLHYPAEGIMFLLNRSVMTEFLIQKKIPRTNTIRTP